MQLAVEDFLPEDDFERTAAAVVILGSGGSGWALSHQLGVRSDRPSRVFCVARRQASLDPQRALHERAGIPDELMSYVCGDTPDVVDDLVVQQARYQRSERGLRIEDGWRYLVHGWSQVVADVFDIPMPTRTVDRLADIAADVRR